WYLEPSETISLISNILDNAIEASLKVQNDAFIQLDIWNKEAAICIKVVNSKLAAVQPEINNFKTTKNNAEEHGYGIKIVKKIVKAHNGIIRINDMIDKFELYIEL
ncbi:MAG: GHKL domain-containing protein, partial [Wujia sp.]